jgi:hypothetical protein
VPFAYFTLSRLRDLRMITLDLCDNAVSLMALLFYAQMNKFNSSLDIYSLICSEQISLHKCTLELRSNAFHMAILVHFLQWENSLLLIERGRSVHFHYWATFVL